MRTRKSVPYVRSLPYVISLRIQSLLGYVQLYAVVVNEEYVPEDEWLCEKLYGSCHDKAGRTASDPSPM